MTMSVNGATIGVPGDLCVSLLDYLREYPGLSATKKGCDQGACGACTVLVDSERILSCLALAGTMYVNAGKTVLKCILVGCPVLTFGAIGD